MGKVYRRTKVYIIAEAATNHKGDIVIAKEMVHAAAEAGADIIKFQSWQIKNMDPKNPAYTRMKPRELSDEDHYELINECQKAGIKFLTSCFDVNRVDFLASLGMDMIKVPSTDVGSITMLKKLREKFEYIILSTGMSYDYEVKEAVDILSKGEFCLMHCVSIYPTPPFHANLARIYWLKNFSKDVGYSDHTLGNTAVKIAIGMGVKFVEKHFTLKRETDDIFSAMSALPEDIKDIVSFAREYETLIGRENPVMSEEEKKAREMFIGRWGNNR